MKKVYTIILFILIFNEVSSQERTFFASDNNFFWKPISFSGEFRTSTHYRGQEILRNYISEFQNSSRFSIGGLINSKSYIWHPNFLIIDVEAEYNPDFIKENFIVIPDQAETRTMKRISLKTTFFNKKSISLIATTDINQTYSNRENLTNIKTDTKQLGGLLSFSNKTLPLSFRFNQVKWKQEETQTDRISEMDQFNFTASASKSFYSNDKHNLVYSHDEYFFNNINLYSIRTFSDLISLDDNFNFDSKNKYTFRSRISYHNQRGSIDFKRLQANENLLLKLPLNFRFQSNYNYNNIEQELQNTINQSIKGILSHKLFLSLNTNVYYEYKKTEHTIYEEENYIYGGNIIYTKKISLKGRLNLSYNYRRQNHNTLNSPSSIQIINENHLLTDGQIELLDRAYVELNTIVVKDINGSIIYQENLDYILIERNNFIEIQRFPGGQIANNANVYVDYVVNLPEAHSYNSNLNRFSSSISIFNNLIELYFRAFNQDYVDLIDVDLLILNYYTQYQYGVRLDVKFATAGVEFDDYRSTIIPYEMIRYYITAQKSFNDRVLISLNGNIRDYYLVNDDISHLYTDISAKAVYRIFDLTKASLDLGYRKQIGSGIDLNLLTARLELTSQLRQLFLTLGLEKYNRDFLGEINNYNGIYFRLIRKF